MTRTSSGLFVAVLVLSSRAMAHAEGVDHSRWDKLLRVHVSPAGWVDYAALRSRSAKELRAYLRELAAASIEKMKTADEKKAFWINAYNAITIQKLLDAGLPSEVPHAVFFGKNIFTERTYRVAGKVRSLDDIEHRILRKRYKDNRIHAALVCGASSCPRLRPEAFTAKKLNRQLDEEARRWVQSGLTKKGRRKNYLDRKKKVFYVSKIFDWYEEDFGDSEAGVLRFLARFAAKSDREFLKSNSVSIRYLAYDWSLNAKGKIE